MDIQDISCIIVTILILIGLVTKLIVQYLTEQGKIIVKNKKYGENIDKFINQNYKKILLVFAIFIFFSRIYKFGQIPTYIGVDEAGAAYDAYCLANFGVDRYLNSFPLYLINFGGGQSALYAYSTIPFIKLFGANIISYRLPELLFYLMGIVVCYLLANKFKNKKTALLYTLLIIICPWNIEASRKGLDCNLLAPMFMLDVLLLLNAKKNWQYIVAGISIGITLYTYCLSWLLIPAFLLVYILYMLYLKKINFKQIILLGIPIFILAIPLIYMIILNKGYATRTNFGIFTIPKLPLFREGEMSLLNIWNSGTYSLKTIFLERWGRFPIYLAEVPLFLVGFVIGVAEFAKSIKAKKFNLEAFFTIVFIVLLIVNLSVVVSTTNRVNILYLPILYIITMGITYLYRQSRLCALTIMIVLMALFINFEAGYFNPAIEYNLDNHSPYDDNKIMSITEKIESYEDSEYAEKYILPTRKAESNIYTLLQNKVSPYELTKKEGSYQIDTYGNYHFWISSKTLEDIKQNHNTKKYILAIEQQNTEIIEKIRELGFGEEKINSYCIMKN